MDQEGANIWNKKKHQMMSATAINARTGRATVIFVWRSGIAVGGEDTRVGSFTTGNTTTKKKQKDAVYPAMRDKMNKQTNSTIPIESAYG